MLAADLGLTDAQKYLLHGPGWFRLFGIERERFLDWLASDDSGPFVWPGWSIWPGLPPFAEVKVSIVRAYFGPVCVFVADARLVH